MKDVDYLDIEKFLYNRKASIKKYIFDQNIEVDNQIELYSKFFKPNIEVNLSCLISQLLPIRYAPLYLQGNLDYDNFKKWPIRKFNSELVDDLSGVYVEDTTYNIHSHSLVNMGFAVIKVTSTDLSNKIKNELIANNDTVIVMQDSTAANQIILGQNIPIQKHDIIIAFSEYNFSISQFIDMIRKIDMAKYGFYSLQCEIYLFIRKMRYKLKRLWRKLRINK
jgi:hypothetical protein